MLITTGAEMPGCSSIVLPMSVECWFELQVHPYKILQRYENSFLYWRPPKFHDDYVTRKAFLILNHHVESVNYKFQPCLTSNCFPKLSPLGIVPLWTSCWLGNLGTNEIDALNLCLRLIFHTALFHLHRRIHEKREMRQNIWRILNERADRLPYTSPVSIKARLYNPCGGLWGCATCWELVSWLSSLHYSAIHQGQRGEVDWYFR